MSSEDEFSFEKELGSFKIGSDVKSLQLTPVSHDRCALKVETMEGKQIEIDWSIAQAMTITSFAVDG